MNRWGSRNQEQNSPKFKQIFESQAHAIDMLTLNNFLEDAKNHSTQFTHILLIPKNRHILHQLLQIAINPYHFSEKCARAINNKITHAAIEILTNLSEDFIDFVFEAEEDSKEDEVVQTQKDYPMLTTIFKIAGEGQLQTTALAYFSKIVTPFIYQRPAEMLNFLAQQGLPFIIRYFWSSQISELVGKVLEAETEKSFFQDEKVAFVEKVVRSIQLFQNQASIEQTTQSFADFMTNLVQKHEDKYERGKYSKLLKRIIQGSENFQFLVSHIQKYQSNRVIRSELLYCLQSYLKIHLPANPNKSEEQQVTTQSIVLNPKFAKLLQQTFQKHPVSSFVSDIKLQLVNYYKVVKLFLTVHPQSTQLLISGEFLSESVKIMKKEQNNNILHNLQREIITKAINDSAKVHSIVQNEISLLDELRSTVTQKNSSSSYANQIFLISEALRQKPSSPIQQQQQWKDLEQVLGNKRKFYAMPIANSLRNRSEEDKWESIQTELILKPQFKPQTTTKVRTPKSKNPNSQPFTMVSRLDEIEGTEVLSQEEDGFPANENNKNNHYYDDLGMPELPLDSDKEEGELKGDSLDAIPQNAKQNSGIFIPIDDLPQNLNQNSFHQQVPVEQDPFDIPQTLGSNSIIFNLNKQTTEDDLPDTLGQHSIKKISTQNTTENLQPAINHLVPEAEEIGMDNGKMINLPIVDSNEEQTVSGFNQLTVSINIAEEEVNKSSELVVFRDEIQCLLAARYKLELFLKKP